MNKWKVILYSVDPDGIRHPLGSGIFWADTEQDACECAMQTWWDPRLEAAGCRPFTDLTQLPQYRVIWEFDDCPDLSYLEQWDTPDKYYDVKPRCPKCGDSMTYLGEHQFKCDADFEDDPDSCDGRFDASTCHGPNAGICLKDDAYVPFEDYIAYEGNPAHHTSLICRVERMCNGCRGWETVESLGGVDFLETDNWETGCYHETELDSIPNEYQKLESRNLLDEAKGDSFFPKLGEHLRELLRESGWKADG